MLSLFSEIMEGVKSKGIGGDVMAGRMEVSLRVGFARLLLDGSGEGVELKFAIAGRFWARLIVNVIACLCFKVDAP